MQFSALSGDHCPHLTARLNRKRIKKQIRREGENLTRTGKTEHVGKGKRRKQNKETGKPENHFTAEDDVSCLVCNDVYSNSLPGEEWIRCSECGGWTHFECTDGDIDYVCHNCTSD